eukprot:scaffold1726_cov30-Prasinocladus_malaysianus.AAC.3
MVSSLTGRWTRSLLFAVYVLVTLCHAQGRHSTEPNLGDILRKFLHPGGPDLSTCDHEALVGASKETLDQFVFPNRTWMVITKQRTGSRWLVDTMTERTGGLVPYSKEMNCKSCNCGGPTSPEAVQACVCKLAKSYIERAKKATQAEGIRSYVDNRRNVGFKFMTAYSSAASKPGGFDTLAASICAANIPVAFMWRRNVLRRLVSGLSNEHDNENPTTTLNGALLPSTRDLCRHRCVHRSQGV